MSVILVYTSIVVISVLALIVLVLMLRLKKLEDKYLKISLQNRSFRTLCDNVKSPIWFKDADLKMTWVNSFYAKMFDRSRSSIYGLTDQQLAPPRLAAGYERDDLLVKQTRKPYTYRENEKSGVWYETTKFPLLTEDGKLYGLGGIAFNITTIKKSETTMHTMVHNDYLTGVPNRMFISVEITKLLSDARENSTKLAVVYVDVDNFKDLNDMYGHSVGNEVLKKIAEKLKKFASEKGLVVGRLGGDEFVVVIPNVSDESYIGETSESILRYVSGKYDIGEADVTVTVSLGGSVYPTNCDKYDDLMKQADMATRAAKLRGKNRIVFYDTVIGTENIKRINIEMNLKQAIMNEEFELYYQPKVTSDGRRLAGFEALLFWNSTRLGFVSPVDFIPVAEQSDLIIALSDWVMRKAMSQNLKWRKQYGVIYPVAVNMSAKQIYHADFLSKTLQMLEDLDYPPEYLELEITESMLLGKDNKCREAFEKLRAMGVTISMDDFGTGYSNLSYISNFPLDKLKIDRRFITNINENKENQQIVNAIVMLAGAFKYSIIAEGVETIEELDYVKSKGVDVIQGFYFSRPVAPGDVYEFVDKVNRGIIRQKVEEDGKRLRAEKTNPAGKAG